MIDNARVIDSHQHFWDLKKVEYPWLTAELGSIHRTFEVADVEPDVAASPIDDVILVQAAGSYEDTEAMIAVADRWERVIGIVAWLPLDRPAEAAHALERYRADARIVGIRHQIHDEPDPDWILQDSVFEGLRLVEAAGLAYDVVAVLPRHLEHVPRLAAAFPNLQIVIDHAAKPPIADRGWEPWAALLTAAAAAPNVTAKLSGLDTAAGPGYGAADLEPYVHHALSQFGADRLMFGSDWPVSTLAGGYARWWDALAEVLAPLTAYDRSAIYGGTAARVYALKPQQEGGLS
ncbi:amidohydrolase family protein [soil metagenome]